MYQSVSYVRIYQVDIKLRRTNSDRASKQIDFYDFEKDSAKSLTDNDGKVLIDLNRAGVAPMEMDDGSFRCDVNISVRKAGEEFGNRVELKHIHKFSSIGIAIDYEKDRQIEILENGGQIEQETRGFDPDTKSTFSLREKEEINEYYFMQEKVSNSLPESLDVRRSRLTNDHKLLKETIDILMSEPGAVEYYELVYKKLAVSKSSKKLSKLVGNWVIGDLLGLLNKNKMQIRQCPVTADRFASLLGLLISNTISGAQAKKVLQLMVNGSAESPENIAKANNWILDIDATQLEALCTEVIELHPDIVILSCDNCRLKRFKVEKNV
ncbi:hypothetical protein HDV02_000210 [Globomyces sp. JEL0801]|nr:hypothetical protein HDV02_000210 [Globomyces sp. JEL0801]